MKSIIKTNKIITIGSCSLVLYSIKYRIIQDTILPELYSLERRSNSPKNNRQNKTQHNTSPEYFPTILHYYFWILYILYIIFLHLIINKYLYHHTTSLRSSQNNSTWLSASSQQLYYWLIYQNVTNLLKSFIFPILIKMVLLIKLLYTKTRQFQINL